MITTEIDMERVGAFAQEVGDMITGGATAAMVVLGDRLGLYAALVQSGTATAGHLASRTGTSERYIREWLAQQAAVGFVVHDPEENTFELPPEHAAVLASDDSPAAMVGAAPLVSGLHRRIEQLAEAFRTGNGIPWGEQDPATFEATERFFRINYRNNLVSEWIPALDGVHEKLQRGGYVADIGCGRGAALILMAEAYPRSRFVGYDAHGPSIDVARQRAEEAGVADRVGFEVNHCHGYPDEGYDVVMFFDAFHDLGDPVGAAAHARNTLAPDGSLVLVEPKAADDLATTLRTVPLAALNYAASTFLCTPNSLSQPAGLALGSQAGEARLRDVLREAGFGTIRLAAESDFNIVLEARV